MSLPHNQQWNLYVLGSNNKAQAMVPRNKNQVKQGRYVVLGPETQLLCPALRTDHVARRVLTHQPSTSHMRVNQRHFRDTVFARDDACVITGERGSDERPMSGLDVAHIYPVTLRDEWVQKGREAWISDPSEAEKIAPNKIFSAQNGIILSASLYQSFDGFDMGVDPDVFSLPRLLDLGI